MLGGTSTTSIIKVVVEVFEFCAVILPVHPVVRVVGVPVMLQVVPMLKPFGRATSDVHVVGTPPVFVTLIVEA
jgi:hypothetical protein